MNNQSSNSCGINILPKNISLNVVLRGEKNHNTNKLKTVNSPKIYGIILNSK